MSANSPPLLVILAGGKSSRLWPLEEKALLEFAGHSLFVWQLRRYADQGFAHVALIANPDNHQSLSALAGSMPGLSAETFVQTTPRGMGDALLLLRDYIMRLDNRPIYVTQVHDIFEASLHRTILEEYSHSKADALLAACEMSEYFPGGYLSLDSDGRIVGVVEKPGPGREPSNLVTVVAHLHRNPLALLDQIQREYAAGPVGDDHYERAMSALMGKQTFRPVIYRGHWQAVKYPWHVLDVTAWFLGRIEGQRIEADVQVADSATISGPVVIESGARLLPGSCVVGPAYIGANTIIGNNALVRSSMLGRNCVVGFSTEVVRSYVANDVWFHTNYVGDSVIADDVSFGSGAITANLRLDEQEVSSNIKGAPVGAGRSKLGAIVGSGARMGVNTLLMPGVKVGRRAFVGPGVVMSKDVADDTQVLVKQQWETRSVRVRPDLAARDDFRAKL